MKSWKRKKSKQLHWNHLLTKGFEVDYSKRSGLIYFYTFYAVPFVNVRIMLISLFDIFS